MTGTEHVDVVVIGGGLAGLAAAVYLARGGERVLVLERAREPGGRARTNDLAESLLNQGPRALFLGGAGAPILRELGVSFTAKPAPARGALAVRGGRVHSLLAGPLSGMLPLGSKLDGVRALVRLLRADPEPLHATTVREWIEKTARTEAARDLLAALLRVATYGASTEQSAGAALRQFHTATKGVLYVDGGWRSLVSGLLEAARAAGVTVTTGAAAVAVVHDEAVRGVRLADGTLIPCEAAVIAAGPEVARELLSGEAARRVGAFADAATPVEAACLDLVLAKRAKGRPTFALGLDVPVYFSVHSRTAKLSPDDREVLHVAKYLDGRADARRDEAELEAFLDLVEPGWREHVLERRFLPRMVVTHALATAAMGGTAGRPGPDVAGVRGLAVAGDWVGGEGMLADAALASARLAARALLERAGAEAPAAIAC